jgi:PleD family two-component response regulator
MSRPSRQETILVVEDDPTLRMSLRAALRSAGYKVEVAATGTEGLDTALSSSPDLMSPPRGPRRTRSAASASAPTITS